MENLIRCEEEVLNTEKVQKIKSELMEDEKIFDLAELFKVFGD